MYVSYLINKIIEKYPGIIIIIIIHNNNFVIDRAAKLGPEVLSYT